MCSPDPTSELEEGEEWEDPTERMPLAPRGGVDGGDPVTPSNYYLPLIEIRQEKNEEYDKLDCDIVDAWYPPQQQVMHLLAPAPSCYTSSALVGAVAQDKGCWC